MNARTMPIYLTAAWREAVRARDPYMDFDHLLIGLIAAGGPAAQILTRHGLDLASARAAAHAVHADAIALLDVDVHVLPAARPLSINEVNQDVQRMPMRERVDQLVNALGVRATERDLLCALLAEPSGMIRDLIECGGAEPETVTEQASASADWVTPTPRRARTIEAAAEVRTVAVQITHFLPADPRLVRSVATDSILALQCLMFPDAMRQENGSLAVTLSKRGRTSTLRLALTVDEEWHVRWDDRWDDQPLGWYDLSFAHVDGGTLLTLTRAVRPIGVLGTALAPLTRLSNGLGLLLRAQNLSFACADVADRK